MDPSPVLTAAVEGLTCQNASARQALTSARRAHASVHLPLNLPLTLILQSHPHPDIQLSTIRYTYGMEPATAGALLRQARKRAGLSQVDLAARAGVTQSVISAYESRQRQPSIPALARWSTRLASS